MKYRYMSPRVFILSCYKRRAAHLTVKTPPSISNSPYSYRFDPIHGITESFNATHIQMKYTYKQNGNKNINGSLPHS